MTETLIEKLQHLETLLEDISQRYTATYEELMQLKENPPTNNNELLQLQQQLDESKHSNTQGIEVQQQLQQELDQLDSKYQSLAEAHHSLNDSYQELLKKCEALEQFNTALLEKNRLAKEHTKVVMQRLTLIDQAAE